MALHRGSLAAVAIFFLFIVGSVLPTSSKQSESSKSKKKGSGNVQLSPNIAENPFLKDQQTTSTRKYQSNPFLTITTVAPPPNSNDGNNGTSGNSHLGENRNYSSMYIHNPFLSGTGRPPSQIGVTSTTGLPTGSPIGENRIQDNDVSSPVSSPLPPKTSLETSLPTPLPTPTSTTSLYPFPEKISGGTSTEGHAKTKSQLKCEEYGREVLGTAQGVSLVGTSPGVIKVSNEQCERQRQLVVGGTEATPGEFPHMVAMGKRLTDGTFIFYCGGTLISSSWVLTAAHCTYGPNGNPTTIRIGFHNLKDEQLGVATTIKRIVRHPSYKPPAMYADIALIELQNTVTFSNLIRPACLYQRYDTVPMQAWVTGWGVTEFGGEQSDTLQKAFLDIIDNVACTLRHNTSIAVPYGVTPSMICAGDRRGGWNKDTCQGDSGGPLQVLNPRDLCLFQIIGITSFGRGCAIIDSPGVYTRVSHYLDWIENIVWPN